MHEVLDNLRNAYPKDWKVKRLKYALARHKPERAEMPTTEVSFCPMPAVGERGELDTSQTALSEDVSKGYTRFLDGDVVVAKITPCFENGKGALVGGLLNGIGYGTTELHVLTPGADLDGRFLYYATVSTAFRLIGEAFMSGSAGQKRVPPEYVESFPLGLPERKIQTAIASFLDRETTEIDELVAKKAKMLRILEEKRAALIARAVTRGIDSKAKMKPSGVEWMGKIPEGWEVVRTKHLAEIYYGLSQPPEYRSDGIPFVRATNVKKGRIVSDGLVFVDEADLPSSRVVRLRKGDAIVVRSGAYTGDSGLVTEEWAGAVAGYDMVLRFRDSVEPAFLQYALLSPYVLNVQIDPLRMRAAQPHLNAEELGDVLILLPPRERQCEIVAALKPVLHGVDETAATLRDSIRLLTERRTALITAAVTGKIDVWGAN
jgi:type I restriction enzyme S subunit